MPETAKKFRMYPQNGQNFPKTPENVQNGPIMPKNSLINASKFPLMPKAMQTYSAWP
jgi:hypothetical protein